MHGIVLLTLQVVASTFTKNSAGLSGSGTLTDSSTLIITPPSECLLEYASSPQHWNAHYLHVSLSITQPMKTAKE